MTTANAPPEATANPPPGYTTPPERQGNYEWRRRYTGAVTSDGQPEYVQEWRRAGGTLPGGLGSVPPGRWRLQDAFPQPSSGAAPFTPGPLSFQGRAR